MSGERVLFWPPARSSRAACLLLELCCALWARPPSITALLCSTLCRAVQCTRLGFAPCKGFKSWCRLAAHRAGTAVSCLAFVAFTRYGHPLRFYIRPHFVKWSPVAALKLRLVSSTAGEPSRVHKTGLMQNGLRWGGSVRRSGAARKVFWSVTCGQSSCVCPRPPCGPHRCAASAPRSGCGPSAPQGGSLSPRGTPSWAKAVRYSENPLTSAFTSLGKQKSLLSFEEQAFYVP